MLCDAVITVHGVRRVKTELCCGRAGSGVSVSAGDVHSRLRCTKKLQYLLGLWPLYLKQLC
jgi:hypothetical protein